MVSASINIISALERLLTIKGDEKFNYAQNEIRRNAQRSLDVEKIYHMYLLFLTLGDIGDWNPGNLLTLYRQGKLVLKANDFEQSLPGRPVTSEEEELCRKNPKLKQFLKITKRKMGFHGGMKMLLLARQEYAFTSFKKEKQPYFGALGCYYMTKVHQLNTVAGSFFMERFKFVDDLMTMNTIRFWERLKEEMTDRNYWEKELLDKTGCHPLLDHNFLENIRKWTGVPWNNVF